MVTGPIRMDRFGRITLPADVRRELNWPDDTTVAIEFDRANRVISVRRVVDDHARRG